VQSGTVEGFSVVLYPGICHVSKGYYHATLNHARNHMELQDTQGNVFKLTPHNIHVITQWAKARGYQESLERKHARTPQASSFADGCTEAGTFTAEQWRRLAPASGVQTHIARRRAGSKRSS
jgi:hypothetical protein